MNDCCSWDKLGHSLALIQLDVLFPSYSFPWSKSLTHLICLQQWIKSQLHHCIVFLVSCSNRDWCLCSDGRLVYDYSSSLEQGDTLQDTKHSSSSGARLWPTLCHCVRFFWSFVFYLQHSLSVSHPTLPRSTESRPRFHWPVSAFPLSHRRLVGSTHKERVANHRHPLINLGQWPRPWYLHRDGTSQSGVSAWEDFDPSTQWLWEV